MALIMVAGLAITSTPNSASAAGKMKLSKTKLSLKVGKSKTLKLKKGAKSIGRVKWKSSNKKVAVVSSKGKVKAKKAGKATITAKYKKKSYKCKVTVTSAKKSKNVENDTENAENTQNVDSGNNTNQADEKTPVEEKKIATERATDMLRITKKNKDGSTNTIFGKLYTPKAEGKSPAIILCHGYNGVNTDFVTECNYYADNGYIAYAFDFCGGFGAGRCRSTGKSTDTTITTEKEDLLTVFDYISSMDIVDENKVFIMGGSQGGLVASLATEERADKVAGMLLYFPALNIPDNWKGMYSSLDDVPETFDFWGLMLGKGFVVDLWNMPPIFSVIGKYDKDVLIIHGDKDDIAPISYSQKAITVYPHAELLTLPGEIHGFTPDGRKTAKENVLKFLDEHTGK